MKKRWLGVTVAGIAVGAACACGPSDEHSTKKPPGAVSSPSDAGAAGTAVGTDAAGAAGSDELAGAGGADPCGDGEYECPAVMYWSHAVLQVDLPVSVADAANAVFTVCRNDECHSAKGSARVNDFDSAGQYGWAYNSQGGVVYLSFDDSAATPFAILDWKFALELGPIASDHYIVAIKPVGSTVPSMLFDGDVTYTTTVADPSLVSEGFCSRCSEVSIAAVDARSGH